MKIDGTHYRSLWWNDEKQALQIIDQRRLPHALRIETVETLQALADAITRRKVRGAPLIGPTAAYGMALAMAEDPSDTNLDAAWHLLERTRPTSINLRRALERCRSALRPLAQAEREITHVQGRTEAGTIGTAQVTPDGNPGFDETPNRLVTGLITERCVCEASARGHAALFPEMAQAAE